MRSFLPLLAVGAFLALTGCDDVPGMNTGDSSASASESVSETASETASEMASESASESASSSSSIARVEFPYNPATQLASGSGQGYTDTSNWAPGICFPIAGLAYANSQVYRPGGSHYPTQSATNHGSQCDSMNYAYPWSDNFCESRSWSNVMCKTGQGHQGQDIRPATCKSNLHWAVAAEDGVITQVGSYTVALTGSGSPHRIYRYLHLQSSSLKVAVGDEVKRGQKIGLVSNNLGTSNGVPQYTTIHLHFEVRIAQSETLSNGTVLTANTFVPPYNALVDAYSRSLAGDCPVVE
ncbi:MULTISPECIES: M23 family metallopeptidase [Asticcacaulis]|uniref:M23 family metallopeptidase n=1 Tax=Asticcacaulis TaxID=76890 RepID=UPI001AEAC230|nr:MULTISPECIES: M23 family metallopeptidase [Asticcacaulis]MBP2158552.1 murein DD-endopeptidase MepM/ murein hydrolase activator NlpD [Asticcacaulis solisilvae]MDR6799598.1 murein DD-endopeptidase MepM/ murein hydrolase activator NlpD [Asticcacaulis sp. BE141]